MPCMIPSPVPMRQVRLTDAFWLRESRLVREAVLPYQWEALNDRVPDAPPGWWMHNMRAAARAIAAKKAGGVFQPVNRKPSFQTLPKEGQKPEPDAFYGFLFQDSDGYKWLEAVSYQLMLQPDDALRQTAQQAIDAIQAAQEEDGYLDTYYTLNGREGAFTNLRDNHELYCFGHLAEAAVAWHQATGQDDLLQVACRFAACIDAQFGPGKRRGCPGHEIAEMALYRLWAETGDERWHRLADFFLDVRGTAPSTFAEEENRRRAAEGQALVSTDPASYKYHQAYAPVRQMYLCAGMADAALHNNDADMRAACEALWRSVVREKMYITGGVGGTHVGEAFSRPYDLPSDSAYAETCASIGLVFFASRMLRLQPKSEYADVMELALYNGALSGMSLDGTRFFYVNPLEVLPEACEKDENKRHVKPERQKWFGCACCPPNLARLVASVGQYAMTANEGVLYIHLYVGAEMDVCLHGQPLSLRLDAGLPWRGDIRLTVLSGGARGTIALRVPGWCPAYRLAVNGAPAETPATDGYLLLSRDWQAGDEVTLDFDLPVTRLAAHPRVREDIGRVAVTRGPLVYCLEEADNGKDLHLLRLPRSAAFRVRWEPGLLGGVNVLSAEGLRESAAWPADALYAPAGAADQKPQALVFVPYYAWANRGAGEMAVWVREA